MGIIKRKKTKVDEIILGIDIGTQFSYLGYIADGKFVECIPEGASKYGISSTIAWKNNDKLLFGFEADDELQKDGSGYAKESISAKTAVRKYGFQEEITMSDGRKFSPKVYLEEYVAYLQKKYKNCENKKKIKKIVVAFPDTKDSDAETAYKKCLINAVKKAFNVKKVAVNSEAVTVADLIAKLYFAQNIQKGEENYNDIMVIDIGAGTSDIGIACWNGKQQYKIELGYQASVNFGGDIIDKILTNGICDTGGNQVLPSQTSPVALIKYKKWIFGDNEQNDNEILKIDAYRSDDPIKQKELLQILRSKIVREKQYTDGALELRDAINDLYTRYIGSKRSESQLEVVVLGNTSTIKPVRNLIKDIFTSSSAKVHFLDDEGDGLSNALRNKGVTNSNFMAFACAFVGGGFNTKDINDIKILNADEVGKNETSLQVADPTIHSASSIFAINVNHKITEPFFNAWDLISSPFAQEGEKYFLVGPYVSTSNGRKELFFKRPEINKLIFKENASELKADNPNSNFLITYRIDNGDNWIGDEKPKTDASGNMYYSYDDYVKEAMISSNDIEIVGYGYSNNKEFPDNEGYYMGTIYNYSPAAPVDKKLQIYFWKQIDRQTGGECYYDKKNQKKIDFETFRNEAKNNGRCNLYS